eukprot:GHVQ01008542.1.p1 GENE.GHVQ01008542.1~~GHVQ01008542.1.p1  ORF type:complete len:436 (-),score=85.67 GHVQ01008542.1:560-1867(-)
MMQCVCDESWPSIAVALSVSYCSSNKPSSSSSSFSSSPVCSFVSISSCTAKSLGLGPQQLPCLVQLQQSCTGGEEESPPHKDLTSSPPLVVARKVWEDLHYRNSYVQCEQAVTDYINAAEAAGFTFTDMIALKSLDGLLANSRKYLSGSGTSIGIEDVILYGCCHNLLSGKPTSVEARSEYSNVYRWFNDLRGQQGIRGIVEQLRTAPHHTLNLQSMSCSGGSRSPTDKRSDDTQQNGSSAAVSAGGKATKRGGAGGGAGGEDGGGREVGDVTRLEVRVGKIKKVWEHPDAEKLYCEEIDIGEPQPRTIASGLRAHLSKEDMLDKKVLILANMKIKKLRDFPSHGMVLCATSPDGSSIELLKCPPDAAVGELVYWEGLSGVPDPVMNTKTGKDPFIAVKDFLKTGTDKIAYYKDSKFMTSKGPCYTETWPNGSIS